MKLTKLIIIGSVVLILGLAGCSNEVSQVIGPSALGNKLGITALAGDAGLPADGASQATIRVEVFDTDDNMVTGATVTLTTTLGTLASSSLTTTNGVAVTTLTSGSVPGTAYIVATVDNISATVSVEIVNFSSTVT